MRLFLLVLFSLISSEVLTTSQYFRTDKEQAIKAHTIKKSACQHGTHPVNTSLQQIPVTEEKDNRILWTNILDLEWKNYQGNPDHDSFADAATAYEVDFSYNYLNGEMIVKVFCYFDPFLSWVKENPTDQLLDHERRHFDLCELYCRKMRQEITETDFKFETLKTDINNIYLKHMTEMDIAQNLYDSETNYSKNAPEQVRWDNEIYEQIQALNAYENPIIEKQDD